MMTMMMTTTMTMTTMTMMIQGQTNAMMVIDRNDNKQWPLGEHQLTTNEDRKRFMTEMMVVMFLFSWFSKNSFWARILRMTQLSIEYTKGRQRERCLNDGADSLGNLDIFFKTDTHKMDQNG